MGASAEQAAVVQQRTVLLGLVQVLVGCLVGFTPPPAVPFFRAIVASHVEFCVNGTLQAAVGFAVPLMDLPLGAFTALEALLFFGTWFNGLGLLAAGITGVSSPLVPTMNASHPPKEISPHSACHHLLLTCGVTMVASLAIAIWGLARGLGKRRAAAAGKRD